MLIPMDRLFATVLMLSLCFVAHADDSAIEGIGGNIKMMKGHPTIRMVSEDVRIKLPEAAVRAVFVFHNDGPATTVKIGFPESGTGHDHGTRRDSLFGYFRSYVDGKRIKVKREGNLEVEEDNSYHLWWTKNVRFGRHQTRVIIDEYQGGIGGDTTNHAFFTYVMSTGASWKGNIQRAKITVDAGGLGKVSDLEPSPDDAVRHGYVYRWDWEDFKPGEDDDIHLNWWNGWKDIWVNGEPVFTEGKQWDVANHEGNTPPKRVGNDIWLPVQAAASYLGCEVEVEGPRTLEITGPIRWLMLKTGSRRMTSGERVYMLHRPVGVSRDENGASRMIELRPLVAALGGKSWWDKKGLHIKL